MKNKFVFAGSYILIITFIFMSMRGLSQDTIVKQDGRQILGKVLEVSSTEVKYKKAELLQGPVYIDTKASILKIKYQGGYIDLFPETIPALILTNESSQNHRDIRSDSEKYPLIARTGSRYLHNNTTIINERQLYDIFLIINDPEINKQMRRAKLSKGFRYVGFMALPICLAAITLNGMKYPQTYNNNLIYGTGTAAAIMVGASIYFNMDYRSRNVRALSLYQQNYMLKKRP